MKALLRLTLAFSVLLIIGSCSKNNENNPSGSNSYVLEKHLIETELPCFVNIMFEVTDGNGKGIPNLTTSDFEVQEDGKAVSPTESAMTVKNKDGIAYNMKTVLMLDNSASVGSNIDDIKNAAKNLVSQMVNQQEMAIYVFSEEAVLLQDFTNDVNILTSAINTISLGYATTNLYGSIISGVSRWEDFYSTQGIEQGFMIAITDGSDTQGSFTLDEAMEAIGDKKVYTVGLGSEQDVIALKQLGTAGYFELENYSELSSKFIEIQDDIVSYANSFYYLYYMSPKRGDNTHSLKLMVKDNANVSSTGYIMDEFSSAGFYSVQQGVVVNNGIENLELSQGGDSYLTALTYLPVSNPSYTWLSSNTSVFTVEPDTDDNSKCLVKATGNIGQTATLTVSDLSNSLSTTVEIEITESPFGEFTDPRDGQTYLTVQIGGQTWMAENLNYMTISGSWAYDDIESNTETYGRLYDWETASASCPDGWYLPSNAVWQTIVDHYGGASQAGGKLKEQGPAHWKSPNSYATNESNFTALPGGMRYTDETFFSKSEKAYFWTSTTGDASDAFYRRLDYDRGSIAYGSNSMGIGFSVRCVKE